MYVSIRVLFAGSEEDHGVFVRAPHILHCRWLYADHEILRPGDETQAVARGRCKVSVPQRFLYLPADAPGYAFMDFEAPLDVLCFYNCLPSFCEAAGGAF